MCFLLLPKIKIHKIQNLWFWYSSVHHSTLYSIIVVYEFIYIDLGWMGKKKSITFSIFRKRTCLLYKLCNYQSLLHLILFCVHKTFPYKAMGYFYYLLIFKTSYPYCTCRVFIAKYWSEPYRIISPQKIKRTIIRFGLHINHSEMTTNLRIFSLTN